MKSKLAFLTSALLLSALPMFAADTSAASGSGGISWLGPAAAIGMAIASGLCALGPAVRLWRARLRAWRAIPALPRLSGLR